MNITFAAVVIIYLLALAWTVWFVINTNTRRRKENKERDKQLLKELKEIRSLALHGQIRGGICSRLSSFTTFRFLELAKSWPRHSGHFFYPVPSTTNETARICMWTTTLDRWNRAHPYGAARWELLEFVIEQLEQKQ